MLKRRLYIFTICTLTFSWLISCKIPLTENQLKIIDFVNKGDTLIFQADNGNRDTMIISDKGTYLQELNPIFGNTWYRPENAFIKFYNTNRDKGQFYDLVHIYGGRTPSQPDRVTIDIRTYYCFLSETNDSLGTRQSEPIDINGKTYSDYYIRTSYCSDCPVEKDSCDIEKLYWSLEKGPLMYIDIKKQKWTRVK